LAGIFGATLLLQFSISTSLYLCITILMVGIEVYGFLPVLDIQLNAFSSTNVVLALGMSIEFTSHIAHQFLVEPGSDRKERVVAAMRFMGAPMFHGAMSSVLAVTFIAGSKTPFLRYESTVNMTCQPDCHIDSG
jgi:predicted RND superfamily exporter protein